MRHVFLAATIAALVLCGALPAAVSAAPVLQFGFEEWPMELRQPCISGRGPVSANVHVVWKRSDGLVKANVDLMTSEQGRWSYCSPTRTLGVGDTVRATSGVYARKFTMPQLTLSGNRLNGTWRGMGLPNRTGELLFHSGVFADFYEFYDVTADAEGNWMYPDGAYGGIDAYVQWQTEKGDFLQVSLMVPFVAVAIGRAGVSGGGPHHSSATVRVRDPLTNALRGTAVVTIDEYGSFAGGFEDSSGDPVRVRVGDRIVSGLAPSIDWHVPQISGSANVATNFVYGNCGSTEVNPWFATVRVFRTGNLRGFSTANADSNGDIVADFNGPDAPFYDPANIKHGDRIVIGCFYNTGDVVSFQFFVP